MATTTRGSATRRTRRWSTAIQLTHLGRVASDRGDLAQAGALLERATRLARTSGQHQAVGFAFDQRAVLALRQGENARAAALAEEAAAACRTTGVHDGLGSALRTIGVATGRTADLERSIAAHRERFDLHRRHGHRGALAGCLEDVAEFAQRGGAASVQAVRLLAAAAALRTAHGLSLAPPEQAQREHQTCELRVILGDRAFDDAWTDGIDRGPEGAVVDAEHVLDVLAAQPSPTP